MKNKCAFVCRSGIFWLFAVAAIATAHANTVTIDAEFRGTYNQYGSTASANVPVANYFAGVLVDPLYNNGIPTEFRNFFSFDVGGALGYPGSYTISSAKLVLDNWNKEIGVVQPNGTNVVAYILFDVTTSTPVLIGNEGPKPNPAIFDDLGTGIEYGFELADLFHLGEPETIQLNSLAISQLNSLDRMFTIGGRAGLPDDRTQTAGVFGGSGPAMYDGHSFRTQLILEFETTQIPEPSSLLLSISAGLVSLGLSRRRRRK